MVIRAKLYPYPVLAAFSDDYVGCSFVTETKYQLGKNEIKLMFHATLDNQELLELINTGKAKIVYHTECAQTAYRKVETTDQMDYERVIKSENICGKLKICSFIVATEDISDFVSASFNGDYRGYKFQLETGCVLAVGQEVTIDVNKMVSDFSNAKSIFAIIKNHDQNIYHMCIDITKNKITLLLPESDHARYKSMRQATQVQDTLNSMLIIPALVYTLGEVFHLSPDERQYEYGSYNWYKSIKKVLANDYGIDLDGDIMESCEVYALAQKLINYPVSKSLTYLSNGYDDYDEEDE